jgi:hypothetical protein
MPKDRGQTLAAECLLNPQPSLTPTSVQRQGGDPKKTCPDSTGRAKFLQDASGGLSHILPRFHRLTDDAPDLIGQLLQRRALLAEARVLIVMLAGDQRSTGCASR